MAFFTRAGSMKGTLISWRTLLLACLLFLSCFPSYTLAASEPVSASQSPSASEQPASPAASQSPASPAASHSSSPSASPASPASPAASHSSSPSASPASPAASPSSSPSASPSSSPSASQSSSPSVSNVVITASNTVSPDSGPQPSLPPVQITAVNTLNSGSAAALPSLSALPTLSSTGIPVPTVTVPSNANNPFMKEATLPEGTVFIAVGAIILGVTLAVSGWSIAMFIIARNAKHIEYTPSGGFGSKHMEEAKPVFPSDLSRSDHNGGPDGSMPNSGLAPPGQKGYDSSSRAKSMNKSGLFFSPTAEVMSTAQNNSLMHSGGNADSLTSTLNSAGLGVAVGAPRGSAYMPSGYYAPTTSAGVMGNATTSIYSTAPSSIHNASTNRAPTGLRESVRAPSAYLDDFLGQD